MTIQVAIMNADAVVVASDRHIYRRGDERSTGRECKIHVLRGPVPGAVTFSGLTAVFDVPLHRLVPRIDRAIAAVPPGNPGALGRAVLGVFDQPACEPQFSEDEVAGDDRRVLRDVMDCVASTATKRDGRPVETLRFLMDEIAAADQFPDETELAARAADAWDLHYERLRGSVRQAWAKEALADAPELCRGVVAGAMSRKWRPNPEFQAFVALWCPQTSVPVLVAIKGWRGLGNRIVWLPRLEPDGYLAALHTGATALLSAGSGSGAVSAMLDGFPSEALEAASPDGTTALRALSGRRWDAMHQAVRVASGSELVGIATGLVRGAELLGFLTGRAEGSLDEIDAVMIDAHGMHRYALAAVSQACAA